METVNNMTYFTVKNNISNLLSEQIDRTIILIFSFKIYVITNK